MINRLKWWLIGLRNPFVHIMNLADRLSIDEMKECAEWMMAEAESREVRSK